MLLTFVIFSSASGGSDMTDEDVDEIREPRNLPSPYKQRRAAGEIALTERHGRLAELMVFGLDTPDDRLPEVAVGQPLSLEDAATALGQRRRNARQIFETPVFRKMLTAKIADLRASAHPRMIRNMIDIANDPGEGTAADRTVRLKASLAVLGEQAKDGGVTVNVGVQANIAADIRPGYVLDLSALHEPRNPAAATIETDVSDEDGELE
jgi:hypothetical protein